MQYEARVDRVRLGRAMAAGAMLLALGSTAHAQSSGVVGYNPGYYQPVNPYRSPGLSCGYLGTPPCPADRGSDTSAPQGISAEQLLAYAEQQIRHHDYAGAMSSYLRAAAMGNLEAKRQAAVGFIRGIGTPRDVARGLAMMEEVAATGDGKALYHLGYYYEQGEFTPRDYARALRDYRASANNGVWVSAFKLGMMYELGEGLPHDRAGAIAWFERASSLGGDASASYYADFLRRAGGRRFSSGAELAKAYWDDFVQRHTATTVTSRGPIIPGSPEWINRITGNSTSCYHTGAAYCPR